MDVKKFHDEFARAKLLLKENYGQPCQVRISFLS